MINILVLMAGVGSRFIEEGFLVPKPMIRVNGKTILQWTTESCPFIKHNVKQQDSNVNLCFAVLSAHIKNGLGEFLKSLYGNNITIIPFDEITRGNLETARISCQSIKTGNDPVLILDSDNKYNHNEMDKFFDSIENDLTSMAICCFDDATKKHPNKWSNARVKNKLAIEIREKEDTWINYPSLIGVFYFSKIDQFKNYADFIMNNLNPVGGDNKKEYYMSMIPMYHAKIGQPVHVHMVKSVVPLGTPYDIEAFKITEEDI